ncbi:NAD(P)-dependent oxidoreductase [Oscillospiraceae bacterium 38-13]
MNVLLIGGSGSFIDNIIIKLKKEGHRISLLTGSRYTGTSYQKVFERYNFTYDYTCMSDIFESAEPDLTIYMGAFDTNYRWREEDTNAVKYAAGLMSILMSYASRGRGRFVYLSSDEVFSSSYAEDIQEAEPMTPVGVRSMVLAQAEEMCSNYRKSQDLDMITLRLDHFYGIPKKRSEVREICSAMCLEAFEKKRVTVSPGRSFSLLYETDAVEFLCRLAVGGKHQEQLYHISSPDVMTQQDLGEIIRDAAQEILEATVEVVEDRPVEDRRVLSGALYESEFGNPFFCQARKIVVDILTRMKKHPDQFLSDRSEELSLWQRIYKKAGWLLKALIPYVENVVCFIPFFMLNNRAVGSAYFAKLDFYLLYVLLFAIVHGQQQATFSALLAVAGYCFRQMYTRSGFELLLDSNTYIWTAQLFILGLTVGYMRDQIRQLKRESQEEQEYLTMQLEDIQDINGSNVRVKNALETQIVNQNDSVGKIYSITSALNQYSPEEVLFYAAEMLGKLMKTRDVAIYTVSNAAYARLFSSTSEKSKMLGNSIRYTELGEMYDTLMKRKVYINRQLDERYPLMANAIFEQDDLQLILMVWGIPWESMTLGQANYMVVISSLIQNAVLGASRYLASLEEKRYLEGTRVLERGAFTGLVKAFLTARRKGLTQCTLLRTEIREDQARQKSGLVSSKLRQSDYTGILEDGVLYVLLANTSTSDADYVLRRFAEIGIPCRIVETVEEGGNDAA